MRRLCADQTMATPQATEMQVEGEIGVEEAVKEMLEIEVEEDEGDPFEGMNNAQVAEIYYKMKPEDRCLFRQFKSFHKLHYDLHGHDAPVITLLEASYVRCSQDCQQGMLTPL